MKSITALTDSEYLSLSKVAANLWESISDHKGEAMLEPLNKTYGYAHYRFEGNYTEKLVECLGREPTSDEIIILVDGGFSHFGATCSVNTSDRSFRGKVNTD